MLYRLPAVLRAVKQGETIYICEGEKDVHAAEDAGAVATTNPMGAGKWRDEFSECLRGAARVVIVNDRDDPGRAHAASVGRSLSGKVGRITYARPVEGKDLSDHVEHGYGLTDLRTSSRPPKPKAKAKTPDKPSSEPAMPQVLERFLQAVKAQKVGPNQWEARCPAHKDRSPSLSIAHGDVRPVVVTCHRGCTLDEIARAVGMDAGDFSIDGFEKEVQREAHRLEVREEARRRVQARDTDVEFPPAGATLADDLATPRQEHDFRIAQLLPTGGNGLLSAQHKSGKTTIIVNLALALADDEPFLGRFEVTPLDGRVAIFNYELGADQFRNWLRDIGIKNPHRIAHPLHLRGQRLAFWQPDVRASLVDWLKVNEVQFLILDPAARAMSGLVDSENDNSQVAAFTDALDQIKREAGVSELILTAHTGAVEADEDNERARGATRLTDWPDSVLILRKEQTTGQRWLRAFGRDVEEPAFDLGYEPSTRRLSATGQTRDQRRDEDGLQRVVDALVQLGDGVATSRLENAMQGRKDDRPIWLRAAARRGLIERKYADDVVHTEGNLVRPGKALVCWLTDAGRTFQADQKDPENATYPRGTPDLPPVYLGIPPPVTPSTPVGGKGRGVGSPGLVKKRKKTGVPPEVGSARKRSTKGKKT